MSQGPAELDIKIRLYHGAAKKPLKFFKARQCHDKSVVYFFGILTTLEK